MERARKRRQRSLKKLYADLKAAPPNVASLELTADGFKATFFQQGGTAPSGLHTPAIPGSTPGPATKLIPGTIFPDDGSPINAVDLVLSPISLDETN